MTNRYLAYDRHHIIPKSKGGTNHYDNIMKMNVMKHRSLHLLFDNKPPHEQLERIINLADNVLTDTAKSDVLYLLNNKDYSYWYQKHTYKHK